MKTGGIMTVKRFAKLQPSDLNTLLSGLSGPTAAGRCAVIREALDKLLELAAKEVVAVAAPAPSAGEGPCFPPPFLCITWIHACVVSGLVAALENWAGGTGKKELEHVDMAEKMRTAGLDAFFGHEAWPPALAVRCGIAVPSLPPLPLPPLLCVLHD